METKQQYYKEGKPTDDKTNPDHYKTGGIETIDIIEAKLTEEGFEGFLSGNIIKYISRYKQKDHLQDLKKALWYLNRLIKVNGDQAIAEERLKNQLTKDQIREED